MQRVAVLLPDGYVYAFEYFSKYKTKSRRHEWKGVEFVLNPVGGSFDGVVVPQSVKPLDRPYELEFPEGRSLLALLEPPDILFLPGQYVRQFGAVVGADWRFNCAKRLSGPAGHNWFVEVNVGDFDNVVHFKKDRLISAVVSAKSDTVQHRRRLSFMTELKKHFGDRLDWFGRGVRDLGEAKLDGLKNYKYHIVIENGRWPDYWTEKLSDAYVANCFPFYCGAPNVSQYFAGESMETVRLDDPRAAIAQIEEAVSEDRWGSSQSALALARKLIADAYHPYELWLNHLRGLPLKPKTLATIEPHSEKGFDVRDRALNKVWGVLARLR